MVATLAKTCRNTRHEVNERKRLIANQRFRRILCKREEAF